jgi:hypothetical protein
MLASGTQFAFLRETWMNLNRFKEYYDRLGFWGFWMGVFFLALLAYGLFRLFFDLVGPYIVGLWLAGVLD